MAGGFMWRYHQTPERVVVRVNGTTERDDDHETRDEDLMVEQAEEQDEGMELSTTEEQQREVSVEETHSEQGEVGVGGTRASRKRKSTADLMLYEYSQAPPRGFRLPLSSAHQPSPSSSSRPSNRPQPVQQIDLSTGEVIFTYPSRADAARSSGVSSNAIAYCCQGTRNSAGGYIWRYFDHRGRGDGVKTSSEEQGKGTAEHRDEKEGPVQIDEEQGSLEVEEEERETGQEESSAPSAVSVA
jgi:hypothetical protein